MWKKTKWLLSFYKPYPHVVAVLLILTVVHAATAMVHPMIFKYIFDLIANKAARPAANFQFLSYFSDAYDLSPIVGAVLMLLFFGLAVLIVYIVLQGHRAWMNIRLEWAFRQHAFNATTSKGPDFFNKFRTGDLVTRMTDDVADKLSWFACSGIFRLYEALALVGFGLAMMINLNPKVALYTASPLPVLIFLFIKTSTLLDKRFELLQARISDLNNTMEACFSGIRVVKAYNRQTMWQRKFERTIGERRKAEVASVKAQAMLESFFSSIWHFAIAIVLLFGGYLVITNELTFGDFVAFESYVIMLIFPMYDIGQFLVKARQSAVSIGRLWEIEHHPPMVPESGREDAARPALGFDGIRFENVSFHFPGSDRLLVHGVDFRVKKGQTVALVGKVGSGKSWLLNLLMRLVDPTEGSVHFDGQSLKETPLAAYRDLIGFVPQEPVLFSDTIEGNIRFGDQTISPDRIAEVIRISQLESQLASFPQGLETRIGARGMTISGGEKQRVAIARALARNPKILILDDCTSALDSRTEEGLWNALHEVMPEMTCFVVTHRTKTLQKVDKILVLDGGRIVDRGTHEELLTKSSLYQELYARIELSEAVEA